METTSPAERVAANIKALRVQRGLTIRDVAQRLGEAGCPTLHSTVSKTEHGQRKVDADDLIALAVVLGVTPNRLLLPAALGDDTVALTPTTEVPDVAAWWWATGEQRIPGPYSPPEQQFVRENRPHDPPDETTVGELLKYEANGELDELQRAYAAARSSGLSAKTIANYLALQEHRASRRELMDVESALFGEGLSIEQPAAAS